MKNTNKAFVIGCYGVLMTLVGCGAPATVQDGSTVQVEYSAEFGDQEPFLDKTKTEWKLGSETGVNAYLSEALLGLGKNETKTITVTPENGFGTQHDYKLSQKIPAIVFQEMQLTPVVGKELMFPNGEKYFVVSEGSENGITMYTLDANAPETFRDLTYYVTIEDIKK